MRSLSPERRVSVSRAAGGVTAATGYRYDASWREEATLGDGTAVTLRLGAVARRPCRPKVRSAVSERRRTMDRMWTKHDDPRVPADLVFTPRTLVDLVETTCREFAGRPAPGEPATAEEILEYCRREPAGRP